jgi:hypothetical protein
MSSLLGALFLMLRIESSLLPILGMPGQAQSEISIDLDSEISIDLDMGFPRFIYYKYYKGKI